MGETRVNQQFMCECGEQEGWVEDGKETVPCPKCGRIYKGRYSPVYLGIKAIYVGKK